MAAVPLVVGVAVIVAALSPFLLIGAIVRWHDRAGSAAPKRKQAQATEAS